MQENPQIFHRWLPNKSSRPVPSYGIPILTESGIEGGGSSSGKLSDSRRFPSPGLINDSVPRQQDFFDGTNKSSLELIDRVGLRNFRRKRHQS